MVSRYEWFKIVELEKVQDGQTEKLCETVRKSNHNPIVKLSNPTEYFIRKTIRKPVTGKQHGKKDGKNDGKKSPSTV